MLGSRALLLLPLQNKRARAKLRRRVGRKKRKLVPGAQSLPIQTKVGINNDRSSEDDDEGEGIYLKSSHKSHNHGVQPLGNLYFSTGAVNSRNRGLGTLQILSDELILDILGFLGANHLGILSFVSKSFYIFSNHDSLWRNLVLDKFHGGFSFNKTWRSTYITSSFPEANPPICSRFTVTDFYSDYLFQSWLCANLEMKPEWLERDNIVRKRGISVEEFISKFDEPRKPVLLEGCIDDWPALSKWNRDYLLRVCGDCKFAAGPVSMTLQNYFSYSDQVTEERPLYLFDPNFAEKVPSLSADYKIPPYFKEDLFSVLENERPDYRWIIIGPARSGSSFHIDPNSTSAWNAVIKGSKKWVLFPPDVVPPGVHPSPDGSEVACPVSIAEWFINFYSSTKKWEKQPVECICKAGEVLFVPNGWWHLVINLEESIAITQNYVNRQNLLNVLDFMKRPNAGDLVSGTRDRVNLHYKFKKALDTKFPCLIDELMKKAEERDKTLSFWDSVSDSNAGAFQFRF